MPLLPNEPRIADEVTQTRLTEQYLLPAVQALATLFISLRRSLDAELSKARPVKQGKPYPLGQCLEISQALLQRLSQLDPATLNPEAACGFQALIHFVRQGGLVRQVWGDLRGDYFQNALLVGVLYVDVANDTVDPRKPPIEILPFSEARLVPISDFHHFSRVAERYWQARLYPNHLMPALAPYFPLISVSNNGFIQLQSASNYMIALTQVGAFRPAEAVLEGALMDAQLFGLLYERLSALPIMLAAQPSVGQGAALTACKAYRDQGAARDSQHRDKAVKAVLKVNAALVG
ncbi:hypothetical protein ACIGG6_09645 [Vreelandella lionensis]|uniref:Uncharacterized protein n=1 Tax=Vreelandella lionensis TaxID=1144478 RepID=A0ABW8BSR6_9GAMM